MVCEEDDIEEDTEYSELELLEKKLKKNKQETRRKLVSKRKRILTCDDSD